MRWFSKRLRSHFEPICFLMRASTSVMRGPKKVFAHLGGEGVGGPFAEGGVGVLG